MYTSKCAIKYVFKEAHVTITLSRHLVLNPPDFKYVVTEAHVTNTLSRHLVLNLSDFKYLHPVFSTEGSEVE